MNAPIPVGQMPTVTAAAHRTHVPVRPLQAKAAATQNSLPACVVVVTATAGRAHVVLESRWALLGGARPALLQHHQPSPSDWGAARAGLQTARYELAPASATWPAAARASQRGAVPGQPGLRPGGESATDGVTGSQAWTVGGGR